jgi:hypothetical protein
MAYRIVAKSPDHLNDIVEDIMSWFETARDYRVEFDTESRKFADPATKQIVTKKIDVLHVQDPMTGKKTVIKFIPLLRPEEMKIEMGGENEHVMKGKIKNMMKGRGEFKTYNKDTLRKMEGNMKKTELQQIIREEVRKMLTEGLWLKETEQDSDLRAAKQNIVTWMRDNGIEKREMTLLDDYILEICQAYAVWYQDQADMERM